MIDGGVIHGDTKERLYSGESIEEARRVYEISSKDTRFKSVNLGEGVPRDDRYAWTTLESVSWDLTKVKPSRRSWILFGLWAGTHVVETIVALGFGSHLADPASGRMSQVTLVTMHSATDHYVSDDAAIVYAIAWTLAFPLFLAMMTSSLVDYVREKRKRRARQ